jgi:hypothetical protein
MVTAASTSWARALASMRGGLGPYVSLVAASTAAAFGLEAPLPRVEAELQGQGQGTAPVRRRAVAMDVRIDGRFAEVGLREVDRCAALVAFDGRSRRTRPSPPLAPLAACRPCRRSEPKCSSGCDDNAFRIDDRGRHEPTFAAEHGVQ